LKTLENIQRKILNNNSLSLTIQQWRSENQSIVFTNGCFDLLHPGHITYLAKAADEGSKLIIGVNSDSSVQKLKGSSRPILDENARLLNLSALAFVDAVILFHEDTPLNLIKKVLPDVLIKGGDYQINEIVGYDIVKTNGGIVITIPLIPQYSTSMIESKIINFK
jgi:rfaE bifunctional protein nucleotidyltransferase chain/domain